MTNNTLAAAAAYMTGEGFYFKTIEGPGWTALVYTYGDQAIRISSSDTEVELKLAFADAKHAYPTGEEIRLSTSNDALISAAILMMVEQLMNRVDGK